MGNRGHAAPNNGARFLRGAGRCLQAMGMLGVGARPMEVHTHPS